jgi:hypothetical protein
MKTLSSPHALKPEFSSWSLLLIGEAGGWASSKDLI